MRGGAGRRGRGSNPRRGGPGAAAAARLRVGAAARALAMGLRCLICIAPPLPRPSRPPGRGFEPLPAHLRSCLLLSRAARGRRGGDGEGGRSIGGPRRRGPAPGVRSRAGGGTPLCGGTGVPGRSGRGAGAAAAGGGGSGAGRNRPPQRAKSPRQRSRSPAPRRSPHALPSALPGVRAALRVPALRISSANNARNPTRGAPGSAGMSEKRRWFPPPPPFPEPLSPGPD